MGKKEKKRRYYELAKEQFPSDEINRKYLRLERESHNYLRYSELTKTQKDDLKQWRKKWLDVTDTLTIPDRPLWMDEKGSIKK